MAAYDALEGFVRSLSDGERKALLGELKLVHSELLAARSEDARVRLVHEFIEGVREVGIGAKKG